MTDLPPVVLPRHVRACLNSPERQERWGIYFWPKSQTGGDLKRVCYLCKSWRCDGCAPHEAATLFARFQSAVTRQDEWGRLEIDPSGWCMLVLTLDRYGTLGGKRWLDVNVAYRQLSALTSRVLKRIGRRWGSESHVETYRTRKGTERTRVVRSVGNRWVATVEAHRSQWPHMNLFIWCPELAELLEEGQRDMLQDPQLADAWSQAATLWRARKRLPEGQIGPRYQGDIPEELYAQARKVSLVRGEVSTLLQESGWGRQSTAERARDIESVLAYGVKLIGLHDKSMAELAKITQAPKCAPERFHRFRSGRKFLPARYKNPDVTGCLIRRQRTGRTSAPPRRIAGDDLVGIPVRRRGCDARFDWEICAINGPKDPSQAANVERAREAELALIAAEQAAALAAPAAPRLHYSRDGTFHEDIRPTPLDAALHDDRSVPLQWTARDDCA